jgi:Transcriptional regulatory protein, C terminal
VKGALATLCAPTALAGCGDERDAPGVRDDRGGGAGTLGAARVETLARTRLEARPSGPLAWVAVTVHMRRLRAKIEIDPSEPRWLQTVWGVGYHFKP